MVVPAAKEELVSKAEAEVDEVERQRPAGVITAGERHNKIVDIWHRVTERVSDEMFAACASASRPPVSPTRSSSWPTPEPVAPRSRCARSQACAA